MTLLFIPGGPGFSSRRETEVLGPLLEARGVRPQFWGEPWREPATGAVPGWSAYVAALADAMRAAAREDLVVATHSFAVHPLLAALQFAPVPLQRIVLIAPAFDLHDSHRRLATLAADDFSLTQPGSAARIRDRLGCTTTLFDEPMREALTIAAADPMLLSHYWRDPDALAAFAKATEAAGARFDPSTFFAVLMELASVGLEHLAPHRKLDVRTTVMCGAEDPIVDAGAADRGARDRFACVELCTFPGVGHWAHLERPAAFVDLVAG